MKIQITKEDVQYMVNECARRIMLREDANMDKAREIVDYFRSMGVDDSEIDGILQDKYGIGIEDVTESDSDYEYDDFEEAEEDEEGNVTIKKGRRKHHVDEFIPDDEMLEKLKEVGLEDEKYSSKNELIEKLMDRVGYYRRVERDPEKIQIILGLRNDLGLE